MIKIYKRNRHKLLNSNKNRREEKIPRWLFYLFLLFCVFPSRRPISFSVSVFSLSLLLHFVYFLKYIPSISVASSFFSFFFFFVCRSLLPFVFLTCFFGGRSLPKTVHKLSVLYDKKIFSFPLL